MDNDVSLMWELKKADIFIKKHLDAYLPRGADSQGITRMHGMVMGYLYENSDRDIFQRDIEARFRISRSTTSSMLALMEKKGLVKRESVEHDARLKKITLTPKTMENVKHTAEFFKLFESTVNAALTAEEKEQFLSAIQKMKCAISRNMPIDSDDDDGLGAYIENDDERHGNHGHHEHHGHHGHGGFRAHGSAARYEGGANDEAIKSSNDREEDEC